MKHWLRRWPGCGPLENGRVDVRRAYQTGLLFSLSYVLLLGAGPRPPGHRQSTPPVAEGAFDHGCLFLLAESGRGDEALQIVAQEALERGGWGPAPGDRIVYDPSIACVLRGSVLVIDHPPAECASLRLSRGIESLCAGDYMTRQHLVRFGRSLFSNPHPDGSRTPRAASDDLLATYIEEVGHSWQEYLYETAGAGSGPRTRTTTWEAGTALAQAAEYQIKMYILSLDGGLLALSDDQRRELEQAICDWDGYANLGNHRLLPYGPPDGWPQPEGWPLVAPSLAEQNAVCYLREMR